MSALAHNLRLLLQYRDLLAAWTLREIRVRYKQSVIGGLWAVLQPLSLMIVFTVVFSVIARVPTGGIPYPIFSYSGLLPWTFLATSITFAVPSLVNNMQLVTKIFFPREILPIASVGAAFLDFCVASTLFVGMMIFYRVPLTWMLLWVPPLLVVQILLTLGVVLLLSAANVFYRDIRFVIPLMLQVWMYASPIIYPVTMVPEEFRTLYMLNPMAGLIDSYRRVILDGEAPVLQYIALSAGVSVLLFVAGYLYFEHSKATFADLI
jgi:lipopolysaccharide transport system permease protein